MEEVLTIRPKPKSYESLTSYICRVAACNYISVKEILLLINKKKYVLPIKQLHSIDHMPEKNIDLELLSKLLNVDISVFDYMSFENVFYKFFESKEEAIAESGGAYKIVTEIEKDKRKFCRECLKEYGTYNLLWQIRDIQYCEIHDTNLDSYCKNCLNEQPYAYEGLEAFKCAYCEVSLISEGINESNSIQEEKRRLQQNAFSNWKFLMDKKETLTPSHLSQFSKERSLAISFIYIVSNRSKTFNKDSHYNIEKAFINGLIRLIKDGDRTFRVAFQRLVWLLNEYNLSLSEFSKVIVPDEFIKSLLKNSESEIGPCKTIWCNSYNTNSKMQRASSKVGSEAYKFRENQYSLVSICFDCFIRHGYNVKTSRWEQVQLSKQQSGVNIGLLEEIIPLIKSGLSFADLKVTAGVTNYKLYYALAYLINQSVIPMDYLFKDSLKRPENLISSFEELVKLTGDIRKNAYRLFGWKAKEFYYYLTLKEVQEFMLLESQVIKKQHKLKSKTDWESKVKDEIKRLIDNDEDISIKLVASNISSSIATLRKNNLIDVINDMKKEQKINKLKRLEEDYQDKIKEFFRDKLKELELTTTSEVYCSIGSNDSWMKKNLPSIANWVTGEVRLLNRKINEKSKAKLKKPIEQAVVQLFEDGIELTYENVLNKVGYERKILQHYPFLRNYINEAREQITFTRSLDLKKV